MSTADKIAVARAMAEKAAANPYDGPPRILLGDSDPEKHKPDVYGVVTGRGTAQGQFGTITTILLTDVQAPVGTPLDGEHALWAPPVLEDRLAEAQVGDTIYAKFGPLVPTKADPSKTYRSYITKVEKAPPAKTDSLGQLVEDPGPQRAPEAAGYGNEPPFAPSIA